MKKIILATCVLIPSFSFGYNTLFNHCTGCFDFVGVSSTNLPGGSTQYIQNTSSLQSGATFYVSSGTVNGQLRVKNSFGGMTLYGGGAVSPPGAYADGVTMGFGGALANPTISIFGTPGVNDAGILVQGGGFSAGSSTNSLSVLTQFSSEVYLGNGLGTSGQVFTTGVNGAPTWTTPAAGGGGAGYSLEPATVTAKFNVGMTASTATFSSSTTFNGIASFMQGITGTTFTFTGPTQSTITYGVSMGSATFTGTGNATIIENGLTGQVVITTGVPTVGQCGVWASSTSMVGQACGGGGSGTINSANNTNLTYYTGPTTVSGSTNAVITASSITIVSSAVFNSAVGASANTIGLVDINALSEPSGTSIFSVGSVDASDQLVVKNTAPLYIHKYGADLGCLLMSGSTDASNRTRIRETCAANNAFQSIDISKNSLGEMDFQTATFAHNGSSGGSGSIVFLPNEVSEVVFSSFGVTITTQTTITSSLTVTAPLGISNSYGFSSATGTFINSLSAITLSVSTASTGVAQLAVSSAVAKAPTDPLLSISSTSGTTILWIDNAGNLISSGTTTTVTSCGTSPSVLGNNIAGTITVGGGVVTSCTLNFANGGFVNVPVCIPSDNSSTVSISNGATTATSAVFNLSATLGGGLINYVCLGYQK